MHSPQATGNTPLASLLLPAGIGGGSNGEGNSRKDDLLNHCVDTTAATATTPSAMATPNLCIIQVSPNPNNQAPIKSCSSTCLWLFKLQLLSHSLHQGQVSFVIFHPACLLPGPVTGKLPQAAI